MIKKYQEFIKESKEDIDSICKKYDIENYTINGDGSIDVDSSVSISGRSLYKLPLNFRKVKDNFSCTNNQLTSLEGCPIEIGGSFACGGNRITSFKRCPKSINGSFFDCTGNNIRDFYGFPDFWEGALFIFNNPIFEIYELFRKNNRCTELLNTTRTIVNGDSIRVEGILDVAEVLNIKLSENWKEKIKSYKLIQ